LIDKNPRRATEGERRKTSNRFIIGQTLVAELGFAIIQQDEA